MKKVLVLGAGGFVGSAIVRALATTGDLEPIAGVRRMPSVPGAVECRLCDATDPTMVADALAGVTYAVNAVLGSTATLTAATRTLCRTARHAELHRIVHVSTMSVYGSATGLVDEATKLDAGGSAYGAAKIACETILRVWMDAGNPAVILRPGIVYGPGGQQWIGRIGRMIRAGRLGDLGPAGDGICNLIHADDVGAAVVAALMRPAAAGHAFNLATPSPPSWNEFFAAIAKVMGVAPVPRITGRRLMMETKLAAWPLQAAKLAAGRLGFPAGILPEPIPQSLVTLFGQKIRLDHRKADKELGFHRTEEAIGLAGCAPWLAQQSSHRGHAVQ
jgi:nucleoside-diphosphate-sugar epimerase